MRAFLITLFLATLFQNGYCGFMNVSIDDTSGDPTTGVHVVYGPASAWTSSSASCPPLDVQRDKAFNKTWHTGIYTKNVEPVWASVSFTGTAVYVWGILAPCSSRDIGDATIGFTVDGKAMGKYRQPPSKDPDTFQYNVLLFSATGLNNALHSLVMGVGGGKQNAYAILDRITYTTIRDASTSSAPAPATTPTTTITLHVTGSANADSTTSHSPSTPLSGPQVTVSTTSTAGSSASSSDTSQNIASSPSSQVVTGTIVGSLVGGCAAIAGLFFLARWIWVVRQRKTLSDLEERYQYIDRENLDCKSIEMREESKSRDQSVLNISRMRDSILRNSKKLFPVMLLPNRDSFTASQH